MGEVWDGKAWVEVGAPMADSREDDSNQNRRNPSRLRTFEDWFALHGGQTADLRLLRTPHTGRGWFASRPIGPDEDVMTVPLKLIWTGDTARRALTAEFGGAILARIAPCVESDTDASS